MSDNCETNGFKGTTPVEDDSLFFWRLHDELSAVNAAILMVGKDPSEQSQYYDEQTQEYFSDQRRDYVGLEAALGALKSAIKNGSLRARLCYDAKSQWHQAGSATIDNDNFLVLSGWHLEKIVDECDTDPFFKVPPGGAVVSREPNWRETMVKVEDLKRWLRAKGALPPFFFPEPSTDGVGNVEKATNPAHEHFAPELALALTVWQALLPERNFRSGVKSAIEAWIAANPDAWQGDGECSVSAKERITVLVNWNKSGGAPKTGS